MAGASRPARKLLETTGDRCGTLLEMIPAFSVAALILAAAPRFQPETPVKGAWPERRAMPSQDRAGAYKALCSKLGAVFSSLEKSGLLAPGTSTAAIDEKVASLIHRSEVTSSFLGYGEPPSFPSHITASVNDELTNGLPSSRQLRQGDLLNLQIGIHDSDAFCIQSWSYCIGRPRNPRLVRVGLEALRKAVAAARSGARVRDITRAIQTTVEAAGYSADRDFVGHAMDSRQRRPPRIPSAESPKMAADLDTELRAGMILTLVVGVHEKQAENIVAADSWTVISKDHGDTAMLSQIVLVGETSAKALVSERPTLCGDASR
jgi:methionyl aminopeptidase